MSPNLMYFFALLTILINLFLDVFDLTFIILEVFFDELPKMINTPEIRIECSDSKKFKIVEKIHEKLKHVKGIEINDIDGVRVTSESGWWLLRASHTQPALVARCESSTKEGLEKMKKELFSLLKAFDIEINSLKPI